MDYFKYKDHYCRTPRQMIDGYEHDWPIDTIWVCECGRKYRMYKQWDNPSESGFGGTYNWERKRWYHKGGPER